MMTRLNGAFAVDAKERKRSLQSDRPRRGKKYGGIDRLKEDRLCRQPMQRFGGAQLIETALVAYLC